MGVGQETELRSNLECAGQQLHSLDKQEPEELRCSRGPCALPKGPRGGLSLLCCQSLTVLFGQNSDLKKKK